MTRAIHGCRGVIPPVCTPLTDDFEVDVASLERLVDFLVEGGADALFVLGSTSEVAFLPDRQRGQVLDTVVAHVAGQVPVLAGVIDMTTLRVLEHARTAVRAGCHGVVATAPFYARTHPAEIEQHYRLLADQVDVPVYAYDLPVSVHTRLDPALLLQLAADGTLAGLKDSSGDDAGLRRLVVARNSDPDLAGFSLLTGSELTVDTALSMGVDGVVPGLGNVDPHGYARLLQRAEAADWPAARAEQERLLRLFRIVEVADPARMGRGSAALGSFKAALYLRGVIKCPVTAPPQIPLSEPEIARIRDLLIEADLL